MTTFADRLRPEGFEEADLTELLVDNPSRARTHGVARERPGCATDAAAGAAYT